MEGTLFRAVRTPLSQAELHQHLDSSFRRFPPASPFGSGRSPRQRREASLTGTRGAGSHGLRERMAMAAGGGIGTKPAFQQRMVLALTPMALAREVCQRGPNRRSPCAAS